MDLRIVAKRQATAIRSVAMTVIFFNSIAAKREATAPPYPYAPVPSPSRSRSALFSASSAAMRWWKGATEGAISARV